MLRIGICDDQSIARKQLQAAVQGWADTRGIPCTLAVFEDAVGLCGDEGAFDLLFLDIEMPGMDGMDLARQLRQKGSKAMIIFVTAYGYYMPEAFSVHAFGYLVKPIANSAVWRILDDARAYLSKEKEWHFIEFPFYSGKQVIPLEDIRYFYRKERRIQVVLDDREEVMNANLSTVLEWVEGHGFYQCSRSTVVNLAVIRRVEKDTVLLDDGTVLRLSLGRAAGLHRALFQFMEDA